MCIRDSQSVIDLCASILMLMTAVIEVDGTRMSRDSIYDQFVCRMWLPRTPLWALLNTSTCGILIIAVERYIAVIYPIWHNVRMNISCRYLTAFAFASLVITQHKIGHSSQW